MLFNSYEFILLFLPLSLIIYFYLNGKRLTLAAKTWLVFASLLFYSWWNIRYLPLILGSIIFNYAVGSSLPLLDGSGKKALLVFGTVMNIAFLGYFKYTDFFISNMNYLAGSQIGLQRIILPLGISFFTFTQIAFLVDSYRKLTKEYNFLNYSLFVTFFPHLLAGPIIHHKEMMPQFDNRRNKVLNYRNLSIGLFLFFLGLSKKVLIADTFAVYANSGFKVAGSLALIEAWVASLSYTLQLYFDFSGYTDMALGSALMFNIKLPINFNSPYKALDVQDFWRRWHITLSRFLRDYIYIPLGGNRAAEPLVLFNLMVTFLIGGLWHGAGWTFVFWGFLHGLAIVVHRLWKRGGMAMPKALAWFLTFNFINLAWVFFRANSWGDAINLLKGMAGMNGVILPKQFAGALGALTKHGVEFGNYMLNIHAGMEAILAVAFFLLFSLKLRNSNEYVERFRPDIKTAAFVCVLAIYSIGSMNKITEFLYFNF